MKKEISSGPKITFAEFRKEVDKYRIHQIQRKALTKEQEEFIILCRSHKHPVAYLQMSILWEQLGWGKIGKSAMNYWTVKLKAQGKIK